jgi:hypothetical protein
LKLAYSKNKILPYSQMDIMVTRTWGGCKENYASWKSGAFRFLPWNRWWIIQTAFDAKGTDPIPTKVIT